MTYQKGALAGDIDAPRSTRVGRAQQSRLGRVEAGQTRAERRRGTARGAGGKKEAEGRIKRQNQVSEEVSVTRSRIQVPQCTSGCEIHIR